VSLEADVARLAGEVERLGHELGRLQDANAVRQLQFKYGYYMDKLLFGEIVELFAEDAVLHFMGGVFRGKTGARRLYGGGTRMSGPTDGILFEHIIAQDIVDVSPDRKTAWGRFRTFLMGGVHESKTDAPPQLPSQFWEGGIYENEYVREDGIWKFKVFNYRIVYQARYEDGLAHSPVAPLMVREFDRTYPEDPRGPDALAPAPPPRWPRNFVMPFHYPNPVTGRRWEG
jgi:hypothetical protein